MSDSIKDQLAYFEAEPSNNEEAPASSTKPAQKGVFSDQEKNPREFVSAFFAGGKINEKALKSAEEKQRKNGFGLLKLAKKTGIFLFVLVVIFIAFQTYSKYKTFIHGLPDVVKALSNEPEEPKTQKPVEEKKVVVPVAKTEKKTSPKPEQEIVRTPAQEADKEQKTAQRSGVMAKGPSAQAQKMIDAEAQKSDEIKNAINSERARLGLPPI